MYTFNPVHNIISLTDNDLNDVKKMQVDFRETHGMIKNMKNSLVAENYLV